MKKNLSQQLVSYWEKGYLYILFAGLIYATWFLNDGVGVLDWIKEISYFEYFKISFNDYHTLPYFWWNILEEIAWRPPIPGTSALVANPETALFSPFMPLLYFFEVKTFIKLYVILQFLIGIIGLFLLRKRLKWTNSQFRIFAVLFLFSPIIVQHIAVAYFTWYNFYLFPWFIFFISEKNNIKSIIGISTVLGLIILQGGIYIVQYFGMFYILYEIFHIILENDWKRISRLLLVPGLTGLLSWVRIATTASVYGEYIRSWVEIDGYNIPFFLFYSFIPTITIPPLNLFFHSDYLGWSLTPHDSGLFWGLSLIMLIAVAIKYKTIVRNPDSKEQKGLNYNAIFIAATFLFIISFYRIWYYLMRAISIVDIPLFESIKNHGIRFIMGAFFAYAVLLANYSNEIWKVMQEFVETKVWSFIKKIFLFVAKNGTIFLGILIIFLKIFTKLISEKSYEIINQAYNGTGSGWLSNRMEGMQQNSMDFYYRRFDMVFQSTVKWLFIAFIVLAALFFIAYIIKKNQKGFNSFLREFPYFKFEMALAIPLILSMSMWANLASSVPFSSLKTLPFLPPEIEVISDEQEITKEDIIVEATPKYLKIENKNNRIVDGYYLPQISVRDSVWFDLASDNATFIEWNTKLMIVPLNSDSIELQFKTNKIQKALVITVISWCFVLVYVFIKLRSERK